MASNQTSSNDDVNISELHEKKVRELNSRFSSTLAEIQECYDFIAVKTDSINSFSKNTVKLFEISTDILEELNSLSRNAEECLHMNSILENLEKVENLISSRYISSKFYEEIKSNSGKPDEFTLKTDEFILKTKSSDYNTDKYLDSGFFSPAPIFNEINSYLKLASKTMNDCFTDGSSRIGDVLDYYRIALELYEFKIIKEIGFYEGTNTTFLQNVRRWTFGFFSWISRSGNGYKETVKKWRYILINIVTPMKQLPKNLMSNYESSYSKTKIVIEKLRNRDYAISSEICDKIIFKKEGVTTPISIGNVAMFQFSDLISPIEKAIKHLDIHCVYNRSLSSEEKWNDINGIIFYSDKPFSIEQNSTLRVYLKMGDVKMESVFSKKKKKYFISSEVSVLDGNELLKEILGRKSHRLVNQTNNFRNVCVAMGLGKNIIGNYK